MHSIADLLAQMERIESEVNTRLSALQDRIIYGTSHDNLVKVSVDIWFNVKDITIDGEKLAEEFFDLATLQGLILGAVNDAMMNAKQLLKTEIEGVFGGKIPPEFHGFFAKDRANSR